MFHVVVVLESSPEGTRLVVPLVAEPESCGNKEKYFFVFVSTNILDLKSR